MQWLFRKRIDTHGLQRDASGADYRMPGPRLDITDIRLTCKAVSNPDQNVTNIQVPIYRWIDKPWLILPVAFCFKPFIKGYWKGKVAHRLDETVLGQELSRYHLSGQIQPLQELYLKEMGWVESNRFCDCQDPIRIGIGTQLQLPEKVFVCSIFAHCFKAYEVDTERPK